MPWSKTKDRVAGVVIVVVGFIAMGWLIKQVPPTKQALHAIAKAEGRMREVVEQDDPAKLITACRNTTDPVTCHTETDGAITITYLKGDNLNRQPYASARVWVKRGPVLASDGVEFK